MKQIALLYFLFLLVFHLSAQSELDSLLTVWEDTTNSDTVRAQAFKDYIYDGDFHTDPNSAILLANQLYKFTEDADYKIGSVDALELTGYIYFRMGDYLKAIDAYRSGLKIAKEIDYKGGTAFILLRIGYIYHDTADIMMAIDYYQRSLRIFMEIDDKGGMSSIYNEFGSIYMAKQDYAKSLEYYEKALAICDEIGGEACKASIYLNSGQLYLDQQDYVKAIDNFQKGLRLFEAQADNLAIASGLRGIADVYSEQGDYGTALEYYRRSMGISEQISDIQGLTGTLLAISDIYIDQEQYSKAIINCKKSLDFAEGLGDLDDQEISCYYLYEAYNGQGNLKESLAYLEQSMILIDSIKEEESGIKLRQIEFSKQVLQDSIVTAERERLVEVAHQDEIRNEEKNRNISLTIAGLVLLLAGGLFLRLRYVRKSKAILKIERDRSESLLLNILPAEIAQELKDKGQADARDFDMVSILFTDFKGFTAASEKLSAQELVAEINSCFKVFDGIIGKYNIEKIKTIGDAYMAAGGLPVPRDDSVKNTVFAALEMQAFIAERKAANDAAGKPAFDMRAGIHTGPVVAGIVGVKKFAYDIWGDTVNTASRMESSGKIGQVNISQATYEILKDNPSFTFESRGKVEAKGKGEIEMYFVTKK